MANKKVDISKVDFSYDDETLELLFNYIPSDAVRSVLLNTFLGCDEVPGDELISNYEIIKVMSRIVNTAFVVAFCRWKQMCDCPSEWGRKEDVEYLENSRFSKLFQTALVNESVTFDVQILSLIELWVGLRNKEASKNVIDAFGMIFSGGIKGENVGITLQSVRKAVKTVSFKGSKEDKLELKTTLNRLCFDLLSSFAVFRTLDIKYPEGSETDDNYDFCFTYNSSAVDTVELYPNDIFTDGRFIVTDRQLRALCGMPDERMDVLLLYMRAEMSVFDGKIQNEYCSFDGDREMRVRTSTVAKTEKLPDNIRADVRETRKFLAFNYKNVRGLAAVIYDTIQNKHDIKRRLFDLCKSKYPQIIADGTGADAPGIYWDNIITLLLVEMGISDFLETILVAPDIFESIVENIGWRYRGRAAIDTCKEEYSKELARLEKSSPNSEIFDAQVLELRVASVLKAMNFGKETEAPLHPFEESLTYKYDNICACLDKLENGGANMPIGDFLKATSDLAETFRNMFIFLQVFYAGLNGYAIKNDELSGRKPDKELNTNEDRQKFWFGNHRACVTAFEEAGRETLKKTKAQTVKQAYDAFCEMCSRYGTADNQFVISDEARRLKQLVTRNYICDVERLKHFATVTTDSGSEISIFDLLGNNAAEYLRESHYFEWLSCYKDVFMFLIFNEDYNQSGLYESKKALKDKTCDPIYPYIVTYYKENVDRDNLKKCIYRVPIPTGSERERKDGYIVTLLMEYEYPANTYYCIPLRYGSSESWWINPVLIPKHAIRHIIKDEKNNDTHND